MTARIVYSLLDEGNTLLPTFMGLAASAVRARTVYDVLTTWERVFALAVLPAQQSARAIAEPSHMPEPVEV